MREESLDLIPTATGLVVSQIHIVTSLDLSNLTQHIERYMLGQKFIIAFLLFPKWLFFKLNFGAKKFGFSDIAFLRVDFEEFKIGKLESIGVQGNSKVHFYMKTPFLCQILQTPFNLESKYWRFQNMWTLKIDIETILEIFWLSTTITQNWVFQQQVPFDMLSHIAYVLLHNHQRSAIARKRKKRSVYVNA